MKKYASILISIILLLCLTACGQDHPELTDDAVKFMNGTDIQTADLKNVVINGYTVNPGNNDVYDLSITVSDVKSILGKPDSDKCYDYSQGIRIMSYHDDTNMVTLDFLYLQTDKGLIINSIILTE